MVKTGIVGSSRSKGIFSRRTALHGAGGLAIGSASMGGIRIRGANARVLQPTATPESEIELNHVKVVQAVMDNALDVVANLDLDTVLKQGNPRITFDDVFSAIVATEGIDDGVKTQIEFVRTKFPEFRESIFSVPDSTRENLRSFLCLINGCSGIEMMTTQVRRVASGLFGDDDDIMWAAGEGLNILEAGMDTIYSPDNPYYGLYKAAPGAVASTKNTGVAAADIGGAGAGFVIGVATAGVATAPAVAAAAIGASTAKVLANVANDILDSAEEDDVPLFEGIEDIVDPPA